MLLQQLVLTVLIIWIYDVRSEHRKLIPKCSNSCFSGPRSFNCFCDSKCSLIYNDCCLDAPFRSFRVNNKRIHNIHCIFVHGENKNFWMVETCKESWSGQEHIKNKCTAPISETSDIIAAIPVTSPKEEVTYKNYYCSLCNEENPENLVEWQVKALCSSRVIKEPDVLQNLTYIEDKQEWGVWKLDNEGNTKFYECYLMFQRPREDIAGIRECLSNIVSTCPSSWRNIGTRRRCKSYVDPIKWPNGPIYKNIDCAICHNQTTEGFSCFYDLTRHSSAAMLSLAMPVDLSAMGQWF